MDVKSSRYLYLHSMFIIFVSRVNMNLTNLPSPMCLHSSVGKAVQRQRSDHVFESRRGPDIVCLFFVVVVVVVVVLFCFTCLFVCFFFFG